MEDIFEELAAVGSDDEGRVEENDQGGSGNRDDEAEEVNDTKRVVKPKRVISRPRPKLDPARLLGPRGIFTIKSSFENIKFKGKGHELDDLNNVLSRLQHWAHRLFPKMTFEDCIDRIEALGNKKEIQVNMHKIRNGMIDLDSGLPAQDDDGADNNRVATPPPDDSAFDQLIAAAPAPAPATQTTLTDEQRARMMRNRLLAEERRMARLLARQKEFDGHRQAPLGTSEGSSVSDAIDSHSNPELTSFPGPSAVQLSGASSLMENKPSCVLDDTATEHNAAQSLSVNNISGNLSQIQNSMEITISKREGSSSAVDRGKETRFLDNSQEHGGSATPLSSAVVDKASEGETIEPHCNGTDISTPASYGTAALTTESASGSPLKGSTSDTVASEAVINQLADSAPPETCLEIRTSEWMDDEPTTNMKPSSSSPDHNQSSATNTNPSNSTQVLQPANELMDVGSVEDWEEAFAEERALASQNQP